MTLSTDIAVVGPIDPEFVFKTALTAVCMASNAPERIGGAKVERSGPGQWRDYSAINTVCGQGLAAWTWVYHREDGSPLYAEDAYEVEEVDDETGIAETWFISPACHVKVNLDTAYGYRGPDGAGCGTLHARVITMLHDEVAKRGCTIKWKNEFTGDWHDGLDGLAGLQDGGESAISWFQSEALPAIAAHIVAGSRLAIES